MFFSSSVPTVAPWISLREAWPNSSRSTTFSERHPELRRSEVQVYLQLVRANVSKDSTFKSHDRHDAGIKSWHQLRTPAAHSLNNLADCVGHELRLILVDFMSAVGFGDVLRSRH
jgi:hypothetical protein